MCRTQEKTFLCVIRLYTIIDATMKIRIPIETFKELLVKGQCKEFREAYQREFYRSLMKGDEPASWEVDDDILSVALKDLKERQDENHRLHETARLNNIGIAAEKSGNIEKAIAAYEQNISIGYKADHAFNRLRILYKKRGDFKNMKRVLLRYAEVFGLGDVWVEEQYKRYTKSNKQSK